MRTALTAIVLLTAACGAAASDTPADRTGEDPLITATRDAVCAETREEREMAVVTLAEAVTYQDTSDAPGLVEQIASDVTCDAYGAS